MLNGGELERAAVTIDAARSILGPLGVPARRLLFCAMDECTAATLHAGRYVSVCPSLSLQAALWRAGFVPGGPAVDSAGVLDAVEAAVAEFHARMSGERP